MVPSHRLPFGLEFLKDFSGWLLVHLDLDSHLEGPVEENRYVYLPVRCLLLHRIFDAREARLAKFFKIIKNCVHAEAFTNLQVLKVSLVSLRKAILKYSILQEAVNYKYCQLRKVLDCFFKCLEHILQTLKRILGGHYVEHVLIDFLDFLDVDLVPWPRLRLVE